VRFSDGSVVTLAPNARARIVAVAENGSRVLLEGGMAHASVVHRGDTRWSVQAGPFEVRVTGTRFDLSWEPQRQRLAITLLEGRVSVSGCAIEGARVVATGETFRATCEGDEHAAAAPPSSAAPRSTVPRASAATGASSTPSGSRTAGVEPAPGAPADWRTLLSLHRYAAAVEAAEAVGLSSICATADARSLMDLGDAAHFSGHDDRAKLVLQQVRRRFAPSEHASNAAFELGRIAFDDDAAYAEAADWFGVYIDERPDGPLVREALGRRMEALERGSDHAGAKAVARRYLEDFPTGPHADVARSIAGR
jgi:hypothetical protein